MAEDLDEHPRLPKRVLFRIELQSDVAEVDLRDVAGFGTTGMITSAGRTPSATLSHLTSRFTA
jgi:hypothetical protein